jgi:NIPSNAP
MLSFLISSNPSPIPKNQTCCPIVELRRYTLQPGKRDVLIELFDREFIESQEAVGMRIIGQFRDLSDENQFVWLRGFPDMATRAQALNAFYTGPVWKKHRAAANATMVNTDNVLLLRPAKPNSGFSLKNAQPSSSGVNTVSESIVVATIYDLDQPVDTNFINFFETAIAPLLTDSGGSILAYFVTEPSTNNFPALPVREGLNVFVWFAHFHNPTAYKDFEASLANKKLSESLANRLKASPEVLKLSPTSRSRTR